MLHVLVRGGGELSACRLPRETGSPCERTWPLCLKCTFLVAATSTATERLVESKPNAPGKQ